MVRSLYKGERLGKLPLCAICMGPGEGPPGQLHLPGGVSVWLCAAHRSPEFQARRSGRDLVASLTQVWRAAGCLAGRRSQALGAHLQRLRRRGGSGRRRPGSYAWPNMRTEAERRFAAGEPPARVIADLREGAGAGAARPPSVRTMQRWFAEGRWLARAAAQAARPPARPIAPTRPPRRALAARRDSAPAAAAHAPIPAGTVPERGPPA